MDDIKIFAKNKNDSEPGREFGIDELAMLVSILLYGCTTWTLTNLHKNAASNIEQVLAATPHKAPIIRPPASHHENYTS